MEATGRYRYARQRLKAGETPTTKSAIAMHPAAPRLQTGACERDCGNGAGRSPRECLPKRAPFLSPRRTEIGAHFLPRGGQGADQARDFAADCTLV